MWETKKLFNINSLINYKIMLQEKTKAPKIKGVDFKGKRTILYFYPKDDTPDVLPMLAISEIIMLRLPSKDLLLLG